MNIPFTTEDFFAIIEKYNLAVFPAQLIWLVLAITAVILIHSNSKIKHKLIGSFLGLMWLWTGIAYHMAFFTLINKAAYVFGGIFILQGLFFFIETFFRYKMKFVPGNSFADYLGYFFILFGIVIYPVLLYLDHSLYTTISPGLPCPSTILTFGFLMLTGPQLPGYLVVLPAIWTVIGTGAALNFGVYADFMMPLAAIISIIYIIGRKNKQPALEK